jgi:dTDP-4-dehydrorhamnose reductase
MRIAITGAAGMLGQDLVAVLRPSHEVLALDHRACDISDEAAVRRVFCEWRPKLVVNCAAFTDVDGCESQPDLAFAVNARGAGNVARAAEQAGGRVFYISTDYVFDGQKREPYCEDDPTHPISSYGRSKLEGEQQTFGMEGADSNGTGAGHVVIRTAWLYGSGRPNFADNILAQALAPEPPERKIVAVADQVSSPTWTLHLARKIAELAGTAARGVLHVVNTGACTRQEMAQAIVDRLRVPVSVGATYWAKLNRPAPRPAYSVLGCYRLGELGLAPLPPWREALEEYIQLRGSTR